MPLYGVSGNARVGALFNIVKLTTAFYDKHFADEFEYRFHQALIVASRAKW